MPLRCWAEIDLAALERNLRAIKDALPPGIRYIAVVKADAYGHGIHQTVARLMHTGIDMFAVANIGEAATIREIGMGWPILLLSATLEDEAPALFDYDLIPTVSSVGEIDFLQQMAEQRKRSLRIHLKIDSGMGRLGIWHEQADELFEAARQAKRLTVDGVYTHFASAENDPDFTRLQRSRLLSALERHPYLDRPGLLVHADNSAGLGTFAPDSRFNAVRVGLLQFGVSPYPSSIFGQVPISPVFSFKTRIGLIKRLPRGAEISYGRTCRLERDSRVAVLCGGYGDGIPISLSNKGSALIAGHRCRILGRVTMDQTIVDVTDLPETIQWGEEACLVGFQKNECISLEEFSVLAGSIPWEILCSVTKRVPRVYRTSMATG